jgi:ribosomal protein S18 acetylase RimI-like enzyme
MRIRRLDANDADLAAAAVGKFKGRSVSVPEVAAFLAQSSNYLVVADDSALPVGFLLAYRLDRLDQPSAKMFIYELEVSEPYRRRGIARSMVALIRECARRERMMSTFVFTRRSSEAAVSFYKDTGGRIANGDDLMFVYDD